MTRTIQQPRDFIATLPRLRLKQCRQAWRELRGVRFADVLEHAQRHRSMKRRASAPASGEGAAA